jgi:hypothetical protein
VTIDLERIWKSVAAGVCGSLAHSALMAFKSWVPILPAFRPYDDLQALLANVIGHSVNPLVPWALSYFNGSVVLSFLFSHTYHWLPGGNGAMKGVGFGFAVWIAMGLIFFPMIGKGLFAASTELGFAPAPFTLLMVLTYSVTLGVTYDAFAARRGEPNPR